MRKTRYAYLDNKTRSQAMPEGRHDKSDRRASLCEQGRQSLYSRS